MSFQRYERQESSLPQPDYPMKPEERNMFLAEQEFLRVLPRVLAPDLIDPNKQKEFLLTHLEDVSSTQIAHEVFMAYGFSPQNRCFSDGQIGKIFGFVNKQINTHRKLAIQTLWLLHAPSFPEEQYHFVRVLSRFYLPPGAQTDNSFKRNLLKRAEGNLHYFKERLFLVEHKEDILSLLKGLYGDDTRMIFSRYYRLEAEENEAIYERRGILQFSEGSMEERLKIVDALEAGRATAEYVAGYEHGTLEWTNLKSNKKKGYRRKGKGFPSVLNEYQKQLEIAHAIKSPEVVGLLDALDIELLTLTTHARLTGGVKLQGLMEFNRKYNTDYQLGNIKRIEQKALKQSGENRLAELKRRERIKRLLTDNYLQKTFAGTLADILYDYHLYGSSYSQISETVPLEPYYIGELKRFLEKCFLVSLHQSPDRFFPKGELSAKNIEGFLSEGLLPQIITRIFQLFVSKKTITEIIAETGQEYNLKNNELIALRFLAEETVMEKETAEKTAI